MCSLVTFSWTIWWHYVPSLPNSRVCFSTKKDIPAKDSPPVNTDALPPWPSTPWPHSGFARRPQSCPLCRKGAVQHHPLWSTQRCLGLLQEDLEDFLSFSLNFMTLTLLRMTSQLFCSLSLTLSDVSLWLDPGSASLAVKSKKWCECPCDGCQRTQECDLPHRRGCLLLSLDWGGFWGGFPP